MTDTSTFDVGSGLRPLPDERRMSQLEVQMFLERLVTDGAGFSGSGKQKQLKEAISSGMTALIPQEMWYASILEKMDRRPLYAAVADSDTAPKGVRDLAREWYDAATERARSSAEALGASQGLSGPELAQFVTEAVAVGGEAEIRQSPDSFLEQELAEPGSFAEAALSDDSPDSFTQMFRDLAGAGQQAGGLQFLTDGDVQAMFRLGGSDLGTVNQYINQVAQARAIDPNFEDPFDVRFEGTDPSTLPPHIRNLERTMGGGSNVSYSLTESVNLLYGMTPAEIRAIQTKLKAAGYYQTNGEAGDEPMFWGDATDSRTQSAWRNLIGDSIRNGEAVYEMLDRRITVAAESGLDVGEDGEADADQVPDIRLTDQARIRVNAEQMARESIGRKLTDEENAAVVEFIHQLERDSQTARFPDAEPEVEPGIADDSPLNVDPGKQPALGPGGNTMNTPGPRTYEDAPDPDAPREFEDVDVNAQIEEYIRRQNPTEAEGRDVALSYNDFTSLLAGPGRGGSF